MIDILGWIGSFMFAFCAAPQALKTLKTKRVDDISNLFISMWFIGEVSMISYVILTSFDMILLVNYFGNLLFMSPVVYYKIKYLLKG